MCARPKDKDFLGSSLAVQWLKLHASNARGVGSIPGQRSKCPHAAAKTNKQTNKDEDFQEDCKQ